MSKHMKKYETEWNWGRLDSLGVPSAPQDKASEFFLVLGLASPLPILTPAREDKPKPVLSSVDAIFGKDLTFG